MMINARRLVLTMVLTLPMIVSTAACNYTGYFKNSGHDYSSRTADDPKMSGVRSYGSRLSNSQSRHDNRRFEYSAALSRSISVLPGIKSAFAFVTDRNVYVGILTDWSATGTLGTGGRSTKEQNNRGVNDNVFNGPGVSGYNPLSVPPIDAYFSLYSHKDPTNLSTELRQVIGSTVRKQHPHVEEVHISANREFVNQLLEFAKASWSGQPLSELTADFNTLVKYTFDNGHEIPLPLYAKPSQPGTK